jgi:acyl-CoA thioesterase
MLSTSLCDSFIRGKKQLVVLDYKLDELINKTHFNKSNVSLVDGVTQISTTHATFANQIIVHQLATNMLRGHLYSYHKGQALEPVDFKL